MPFLDGEKQERRARTVLLAGRRDKSWELLPIRLLDRVRAHLDSIALDQQLAAGEPTTTDRARAVRAAMLVAPAKRGQLATGWQSVLRPTRPAPSGRLSVVSTRPEQLRAARTEIEELVVALRAEWPVAPRGVALANLLLTDGTGPLYNAADPRNVRDEVREALRHLNSSHLSGAQGAGAP
jgi:hypothetical protein